VEVCLPVARFGFVASPVEGRQATPKVSVQREFTNWVKLCKIFSENALLLTLSANIVETTSHLVNIESFNRQSNLTKTQIPKTWLAPHIISTGISLITNKTRKSRTAFITSGCSVYFLPRLLNAIQ